MQKKIGTLTIQNPTVNIRRGPTTTAGILQKAKAGEVFDVVAVLNDPTGKTVEQWAQIVLSKNMTETAYVCFRLASGVFLAHYEPLAANPPRLLGEYERGWNDALDASATRLLGLRK